MVAEYLWPRHIWREELSRFMSMFWNLRSVRLDGCSGRVGHGVGNQKGTRAYERQPQDNLYHGDSSGPRNWGNTLFCLRKEGICSCASVAPLWLSTRGATTIQCQLLVSFKIRMFFFLSLNFLPVIDELHVLRIWRPSPNISIYWALIPTRMVRLGETPWQTTTAIQK